MRRGFALLMGISLAALACEQATPDATRETEAPAPESNAEALTRIHEGPHDIAVIDMEDLGTIRIELLPEIAPKTVDNFAKLARSGFYDGTYFHRVIPGFMIQGGDPATKNVDPRDDGGGGPGYTIEDEFTDYPHLRGTVSMANKGSSDSGGSQFFIVHRDERQMDGKYTAFGRVIEGIEVVDTITELELDAFGRFGPQDRPYPVSAVVESLRIEPAGDRAGASPPADTSR